MIPHSLSLPPELFGKAFPFHLAFNKNKEIVQAGEVLQRISHESLIGSRLEENYQIRRPKIKTDFEMIRKQSRSMFLLESLTNGMQLKGQMLYVEAQEIIFFLCSIWVTDVATLKPLQIELKDFAIHDPIVDFLFLLQTKETTLADAKQLNEELRQQGIELRLKMEMNERLQSENLRLNAELEVTRQLQKMILPKEYELKEIEGLEIACFMEPADEVGGDYYDVLKHHGGVKIGIGDVTGHGLESGVLMIMVQTAVRTLLENNQNDPVQFLSVLNRTIYENVQRMNSDKTLTLCLLDYKNGMLRFSGQHEEIILVRAGGIVEHIDTIDLGFPIGLESDITTFLNQTQIYLNTGDIILLYTDGITEAENMAGVHYGLERLCDVASKNWQLSAPEIMQNVIADLRLHISEQKIYDDITLLVLKQK